jgi:hypothetical protein
MCSALRRQDTLAHLKQACVETKRWKQSETIESYGVVTVDKN